MLKSILIVTISVLNLEPVEEAYQAHFDYQLIEQSVVSEELAAVWDTPAMVGHRYLIMQPASKDNSFLRFVESSAVEGYAPMQTYGWNATELLVTDPDALAERLGDSPFEIVGPPKDLWVAENAPRAMQVIGPGNELLYLTRNNNFEIRAAVDRVFIMVVGGPSMATLSEFYSDRMGLGVGEATPFQISVISRAQGLPMDTTYPLAVARISDRFLIELDEYPAVARARPIADGELPPGVAMVTFEADDLAALNVSWRADAKAIQAAPYNGRRAAVTVGPAGEWIEVIEN